MKLVNIGFGNVVAAVNVGGYFAVKRRAVESYQNALLRERDKFGNSFARYSERVDVVVNNGALINKVV